MSMWKELDAYLKEIDANLNKTFPKHMNLKVMLMVVGWVC